MIYQIIDWQTHFENDRSKERDRCSFVCVPNKQHGMGFSYVMAEKDGAAIYGIWQLILGACSQQKRPRNGWLTSNGESDGTPWGVDDLSIKFRRPKEEIARALVVLCSAKVNWVRIVKDVDNQDSPSTPYQLPTNSPPTPLERKGKEGNGIEGKEENSLPNWEPTPEMLRIGKLLRRRATTVWSDKELKAYRKIGEISEEDFQKVESYYFANWPENADYRFRDLETLLNNWNKAVDRARNFKPPKPF